MTAEEISKLAKFLEISLGDGNYSNLNHNKEYLKQFISDFKHVCKQLNNRKLYMTSKEVILRIRVELDKLYAQYENNPLIEGGLLDGFETIINDYYEKQ